MPPPGRKAKMYLSKNGEHLLEQINRWSHQKVINGLILSDEEALKLFTELEVMLIEQKRARIKSNEKVRQKSMSAVKLTKIMQGQRRKVKKIEQ